MALLTLKETSERLKVSERTLRRWIKAGKLQAELVPGAYGDEYRIDEETLGVASQVIDVVRIERPTDPMLLGLTVARAVSEAMEEANRPVMAELTELRQSVQTLLERTQPKEVAVEVSPEPPKRPWWKRLFEP
jgi:excisionase family DNA binding protein